MDIEIQRFTDQGQDAWQVEACGVAVTFKDQSRLDWCGFGFWNLVLAGIVLLALTPTLSRTRERGPGVPCRSSASLGRSLERCLPSPRPGHLETGIRPPAQATRSTGNAP